MTKEQTEFFLHLLSALVEAHGVQAKALESIATSLDSLDKEIEDLSYHYRLGGGA